MAVAHEKGTMAVQKTDSPQPSIYTPDGTSEHPEKAITGVSNYQYPHGVKFILLAGATWSLYS
jgi:hypothetical protein